MDSIEKEICFISKQSFPVDSLVHASVIKPQLLELIKKDFPDFTEDKFVSNDRLNSYRKKYLENLIKKENRNVSKLEKEVLKAIQDNKILSENVESEMQMEMSVGDRLADKIADFGGSWTFIICFFSFLLCWMAINVFALSNKSFDPYPFILLNLLLSCIAAIQAPIIMMSQNRQEQKDRLRSEQDYKINLKAELEIRLLHEKLDHMVKHQNKRLMDMVNLQLDYLEVMTNKINSKE